MLHVATLFWALASVGHFDAAPLNPPRFHHVEVGAGVRLHVAESGPSDGRVIVMLHGYSDSWQSYARILPYLPRDVRAVMPELRGHGHSTIPATGYGVPVLAADIVALLERMDLRGVTLVGHSLGSLVAQEVALRAPDRVTRLILVGSAASARNPAVLGVQEVIASFRDSVPAAFVSEFQRSTVTRPVPAAFMDSAIATSRRMPLLVWQEVAAGLVEPGSPARLANLTVPTRLIWGDQDGVFSRADQDALLQVIPHAALQVYAGTGHAPHWEEPARFAADVIAFMTSGPATARTR